jgi:hypothetical protein
MVDRFVSLYEVLFDANSSAPILSKSRDLIYNIGKKEGLTNVGDSGDEVLNLNKNVFVSELKNLLATYDKIDPLVFFKLIHVAFDRSLNEHRSKNLIFYHIHNPGTHSALNFTRFNRDTKWLILVREPIQSCESWVRQHFLENNHFDVASRILTMLYEIDNIIYKTQKSIGVRLEDIKRQPKKTIPALCNWMGIEENECLYEMTVQGKKWWGDPASPDYSKDGMEPFGKTSIDRAVGSVFSKNDQFILRTLFHPFNSQFGYTGDSDEDFKNNLKKIRPMIDEMFDFEKNIAKKMKMSFERFINSGSYMYLRAGLIDRWTTLNEFHKYPNMIKPLKI